MEAVTAAQQNKSIRQWCKDSRVQINRPVAKYKTKQDKQVQQMGTAGNATGRLYDNRM